jgi:hypothetical protein
MDARTASNGVAATGQRQKLLTLGATCPKNSGANVLLFFC